VVGGALFLALGLRRVQSAALDLYWHFVGALWLAIFLFFYVV
jgi:heme/copper-type cytochrome/quinol oxidase subunit 3